MSDEKPKGGGKKVWDAFIARSSRRGEWRPQRSEPTLNAVRMLRLLSDHARDLTSQLQDIDPTLDEEGTTKRAKDIVSSIGRDIARSLDLPYTSEKASILDLRSLNKVTGTALQVRSVSSWLDFFIKSLRARKLAHFGLDTTERTSFLTLVAQSSNLLRSIAGPDGYQFFAHHFFQGNMQYAYTSLSQALKNAGKPMDELEWGGCFFGDTKRFATLKNEIVKWGQFITTYKGPEGYAKFADAFFGGQMQSAFSGLSALLKTARQGKPMDELEWGKVYLGTSETFRKEVIRVS